MTVSGKRGIFVVAAGVLAIATLCLAGILVSSAHTNELLESYGTEQLTQELSQTSFRTNLVHPYNTMHLADQEFINPNVIRERPMNPQPVHPYHAGTRPFKVHHSDFEHEPYGHKTPWGQGPEGALVKYEKSALTLEGHHYMVDPNGVVRDWTDELPVSEVKGNAMSKSSLRALSPMKKPAAPSTQRIAEKLLHNQQDSIAKSFRSVNPGGMFHDTIMDSKTGKQIEIPDVQNGEFECLPGLVKCQDQSCVAHVSYCAGCDTVPVPDHCTAYEAKPSGWSPSGIGCDPKDLVNCGSLHGTPLFEPGEAVSGGDFLGGLA